MITTLVTVCATESGGGEQQENVFFAQTFFIKLEILREPMELKHKHVYTFLCVSFSKVLKNKLKVCLLPLHQPPA